MRLEARKPKLDFATHLREVNGDTKTSAPHSKVLARCVAGPDPMDLPITNTSHGSNCMISVTKFHTGSISSMIDFSQAWPGYIE